MKSDEGKGSELKMKRGSELEALLVLFVLMLTAGTAQAGYNPKVVSLTASAKDVIVGTPVTFTATLQSPGPYTDNVTLNIAGADSTKYDSSKPSASTVTFQWDTSAQARIAEYEAVADFHGASPVAKVKVWARLVKISPKAAYSVVGLGTTQSKSNYIIVTDPNTVEWQDAVTVSLPDTSTAGQKTVTATLIPSQEESCTIEVRDDWILIVNETPGGPTQFGPTHGDIWLGWAGDWWCETYSYTFTPDDQVILSFSGLLAGAQYGASISHSSSHEFNGKVSFKLTKTVGVEGGYTYTVENQSNKTWTNTVPDDREYEYRVEVTQRQITVNIGYILYYWEDGNYGINPLDRHPPGFSWTLHSSGTRLNATDWTGYYGVKVWKRSIKSQ
jgi:hypothetical protein